MVRWMKKAQVLVRAYRRRIDMKKIVREVSLKSPAVHIDVHPTTGDFDYRLSIEAPTDAEIDEVLAKVKASGAKSLSTFASE